MKKTGRRSLRNKSQATSSNTHIILLKQRRLVVHIDDLDDDFTIHAESCETKTVSATARSDKLTWLYSTNMKRHSWATWVADSDIEAIDLLFSSLEQAQCLNSSRSSVDGEDIGCGRIFWQDGVSQQRIQRLGLIVIMGQQLSHKAAWKPQEPEVKHRNNKLKSKSKMTALHKQR